MGSGLERGVTGPGRLPPHGPGNLWPHGVGQRLRRARAAPAKCWPRAGRSPKLSGDPVSPLLVWPLVIILSHLAKRETEVQKRQGGPRPSTPACGVLRM